MNSNTSTKTRHILSWVFQVAVAVIFFQTLFFKFTAAPESVYIFETVGMEPWGRIGSGLVELAAGILLLWPGRAWIGAVLGLGTISGAIFFHLTTLGIEVLGDGGTLFYLALAVFASCFAVLWLQREQAIAEVRSWTGSGRGRLTPE